MKRVLPYLFDLITAVILILLPGIRGYSNWRIDEYALLAVIFILVVYQNHRKKTG